MLRKSLYVFSIKIFLIIQTNKQMISVGSCDTKSSQFMFAIIVIKNSFCYIFDQMQPFKKNISLTSLTPIFWMFGSFWINWNAGSVITLKVRETRHVSEKLRKVCEKARCFLCKCIIGYCSSEKGRWMPGANSHSAGRLCLAQGLIDRCPSYGHTNTDRRTTCPSFILFWKCFGLFTNSWMISNSC